MNEALIIRAYRDRLNLSQKRFGIRYNRTDKTVSCWETGRLKPPQQLVIEAEDFLMKGGDKHGRK